MHNFRIREPSPTAAKTPSMEIFPRAGNLKETCPGAPVAQSPDPPESQLQSLFIHCRWHQVDGMEWTGVGGRTGVAAALHFKSWRYKIL